jgi:hypothetical protein
MHVYYIFLLHPNELVSNTYYSNSQDINLYLLAILNYEEDIAMYTIKVANDSRAHNRIVVYRPSKNTITQNELISLWEHKNGQIFNKVFVPEEDIIKLSQSKTLLHSIFSFRFEYKKKNNFLISLMNKTCI